MMSLGRLALKNLTGSAFRSWVVGVSALLIAAFVLTTTLIMRGAESSLELALQRLGADVVVVPQGTAAKVETALLMGVPTQVWMPAERLQQVAQIEGVGQVSPQMYLSTLENAACCSVSNMFMVAYDPQSDFTIEPWLKSTIGEGLRLGEAVGGTYIFTPEGEQNIKLFGYFITLKANLEPTGSGLDQSMFLTFDTAHDIARISQTQAVVPLEIPSGSISAVMVKAAPGYEPSKLAVEIVKRIPGVTAIESPNLFQSYRKQMTGLLRSVGLVLSITWVLAVAMIGLVFSMAAFERKRELGVLRALGAPSTFIFKSLILEAGLLAAAGGVLGAALAALLTFYFRRAIVNSIGIPFLFPPLPALLAQIGLGLALALVSVALAALLPAYRVSRQDPAVAMRE